VPEVPAYAGLPLQTSSEASSRATGVVALEDMELEELFHLPDLDPRAARRRRRGELDQAWATLRREKPALFI